MTSIQAPSRSLSNSIAPRCAISFNSVSGSDISGERVAFGIFSQIVAGQFVAKADARQSELARDPADVAVELLQIGDDDRFLEILHLVLQRGGPVQLAVGLRGASPCIGPAQKRHAPQLV